MSRAFSILYLLFLLFYHILYRVFWRMVAGKFIKSILCQFFEKKKRDIYPFANITTPRKTACFPYLLLRPQNTTWWLRHDEIKPELKYWWSKFPSPCSSFLVYRPHITRISASFGMSLSITSIITPFPPRLSCLSGYANKYKFQFASPSQ